MAVSYIEQECPDCGELKMFQEFSSFTGVYRRCMECGYYESEMVEDYEIPTNWDIINS